MARAKPSNSQSKISPLNLKSKLKKSLSPASWALLDAIRVEAEMANAPLYIVGGFVRDLLLGRPKLDLDLVVEGDAIRLGRVLVKRLGGHLLPHAAFGTAIWSLEGDEARILRNLHLAAKKQTLPPFIDLISARRESYARSGALPDVEFADIHEDQYRRDFTINTLALRLDGTEAGQLLDPWRGLADLQHRRLRTLHAGSFADDPTRILRILRFAGRLKFKIETETAKHLKASIHNLDVVSGERILNELALALVEHNRVAILKEMQRMGVLKAIDPDLRFDAAMAKDLRLLPAPARPWQIEEFSPAELGFVIWWQHLPLSAASAVCDRLRTPLALRRAVLAASRLRTKLAALRKLAPSQIVEILEREPMLTLYALHLGAPPSIAAVLKKYASVWRNVHPRADGNSLRARGLQPGPAYGRILARLRSAWLDGEIKTAKQEHALLEKLIDEAR